MQKSVGAKIPRSKERDPGEPGTLSHEIDRAV
jgi:hypothetical protein